MAHLRLGLVMAESLGTPTMKCSAATLLLLAASAASSPAVKQQKKYIPLHPTVTPNIKGLPFETVARPPSRRAFAFLVTRQLRIADQFSETRSSEESRPRPTSSHGRLACSLTTCTSAAAPSSALNGCSPPPIAPLDTGALKLSLEPSTSMGLKHRKCVKCPLTSSNTLTGTRTSSTMTWLSSI